MTGWRAGTVGMGKQYQLGLVSADEYAMATGNAPARVAAYYLYARVLTEPCSNGLTAPVRQQVNHPALLQFADEIV